MTRKMHKWTNVDEDKLADAIKQCAGLNEHYEQVGATKSAWWDTVAGRLAPEILITGNACSKRWQLMQRRNKPDKWEECAKLVDSSEQELSEAIYDKVDRIDRRIARLCEEFGLEV